MHVCRAGDAPLLPVSPTAAPVESTSAAPEAPRLVLVKKPARSKQAGPGGSDAAGRLGQPHPRGQDRQRRVPEGRARRRREGEGSSLSPHRVPRRQELRQVQQGGSLPPRSSTVPRLASRPSSTRSVPKRCIKREGADGLLSGPKARSQARARRGHGLARVLRVELRRVGRTHAASIPGSPRSSPRRSTVTSRSRSSSRATSCA